MKFLVILVVAIVGCFYMLAHIQSEALTTTFCKRWSEDKTERMFDAAISVRNKELEKDVYADCKEGLKDASVLDVMIYSVKGREEDQ